MKVIAQELGLAVESPERARSPEFVERVQQENADFLLVASYGQILSQKLLDSAKQGGINLHGSILPKYRGAAPIQRCIEAGDTETGITLMQMDKGMDTGDIIEIARTPIGSDETYGELQDRLAIIAAQLVCDWKDRLAVGDYPKTPQDGELASLAPKIDKTEAEIDFHSPAIPSYNRIRAFSPVPCPFMATRVGTAKIKQARLGSGTGQPGTVLSLNDGLEVAMGEGSLKLLAIQPEGKKPMSGRDYASGFRIRVGDSLIEP
jgi:methionyl-tRNA formyltransferase